MTLEIKTASLQPVRQTFANVARRFGEKPATRYQEATYDAQATANFHYRPLWMPDKTLNDPTHTAIKMKDWYVFRDPRQFYYGAYVQNRARMQESAETNYGFFEKRELAQYLSEDVKAKVTRLLLPLRHIEQTANLNFMSGSAYGYGTTITQACLYAGMDSLGMAQYVSRIGLLIDGNSADSLSQAKEAWMQDAAWQGLRALCEKTLVQKDWFELLLVQSLLINTVVHQVVYQGLVADLAKEGGRDLDMLLEFMLECHKDLSNWSDSVFKIAAAESEENKQQLQNWLNQWLPQVQAAFMPYIQAAFADQADQVWTQAQETIAKRVTKAGLSLGGEA
ncbi:phenol hydroxylase [Alcaligenes faecalis]|uniref:aromatic/alkene monooxygenase hydroxylase subunit beta n=1 Tax=Alcaligenes faecalis TaxID=511 RepID=UPI0005F8CA6C|nr:aromatic/alkene monooxygenase hydroxylase subunit beta [Alcaligenes faecalis]ALO39961.1 phenol hydroxylase [Alcaligenes faecalis]